MKPHLVANGGSVVAYCGDGAEIAPSVVRDGADLILTSPPYGTLRDYGGHGFDFDRMADACVRSLHCGGVLVWVVGDVTVDGSETGEPYRQALHFLDLGLKLHDTMIYAKSGTQFMSPGRYRSMFEFMFVFSKGRPRVAHLITMPAASAGRKNTARTKRQRNGTITPLADNITADDVPRGNVWTYAQQADNQVSSRARDAGNHPAPFPLALAKDHIRTWTNPGDLVLDPMAGSGTTLRAAMDLERRAIGIEIHEPYLEIIRHRTAQQTLPLEVPA